MKTPVEIGLAIRAHRKRRGMTIREMCVAASELGATFDTSKLSRVENGISNLHLNHAEVIASVLGVTVDDFLHFDSKRAEIELLEARLAELRGDLYNTQEN